VAKRRDIEKPQIKLAEMKLAGKQRKES